MHAPNVTVCDLMCEVGWTGVTNKLSDDKEFPSNKADAAAPPGGEDDNKAEEEVGVEASGGVEVDAVAVVVDPEVGV